MTVAKAIKNEAMNSNFLNMLGECTTVLGLVGVGGTVPDVGGMFGGELG